MKNVLLLSAVLAFASCKKEASESTSQDAAESYSEGHAADVKTPEVLGKEIFEGKGNCTSCHLVDQKVIGPSIQEIAKIYQDKKGNITEFLKGKAEPIVDPSQFSVMQTNFPITQAMSDEELQAIETYMYSKLK